MKRGGRGVSNRIARNFSTMTSVKVASDLFTFALFVTISRTFGQEGVGQYSFAMAVTGFCALFADFGLYNLTVQKVSRKSGSPIEDIGVILTLRLLCSGLGLLLILAVLPWLPLSPVGIELVRLLAIYQVAYRLTLGLAAFFVARERMGTLAGLEFGLRCVAALGGMGVAMAGGDLIMAVSILPATACLEVFVALGLIIRSFGIPKLCLSPSKLWEMAVRSTPYGMSGLLFQLQSRMDVLLLGVLLSEAAVGVYNAGYRIVFLLSFLAYYAGMAIFPVASRFHAESAESLRELYHSTLRIFVLVAIPAASGLALIAPELVTLVFGDDFEATVPVLRGLAILVFVSGLKNLLNIFMMASERQNERLRSQWWAATANLLLALLLIPIWGIVGAVAAVVTAETFLCLLLLTKLRSEVGWPEIGGRLCAAVLGSCAFGVPTLMWGGVPMVVLVPTAIVAYGIVLGCFPGVRNAELTLLVRQVRRNEGDRPSKTLVGNGAIQE
ncbi:oligosaccharide flippase family protein [Myxococcota bacterium]|nr:oligosaccharide flippase family protein [Myxococcota bacterium]